MTMKKRYEVYAEFVGKMFPDYLTDHHCREGELLLSCYPSHGTDPSSMAGALMESLGMGMDDVVPEEIEDTEIRSAIYQEVMDYTPRTFWPVKEDGDEVLPQEADDETEAEDQPTVYVVLHWEEIPVVKHRVFIQLEVECYADERAEAERRVGEIAANSLAGWGASPAQVLDNHDQRLEKHIDLCAHRGAGLLPTADVSLWPNNDGAIWWIKSKDGRYGFRCSGGEGPAGFGLNIHPFTHDNVDLHGNCGQDYEVFGIKDVRGDFSVTAYKSDEHSQAFRAWCNKEGPHPGPRPDGPKE